MLFLVKRRTIFYWKKTLKRWKRKTFIINPKKEKHQKEKEK
jgi:hypothetical protein